MAPPMRGGSVLTFVFVTSLSGCLGDASHEGPWRVFMGALPPGVDQSYELEVRRAFDIWTTPGKIEFAFVPTDLGSEISVQFIREWGGQTLGQHYAGLAQIGVGDSECGSWQPFTLGTVRNIAVHEIGHALGLDHSDDPDSIMYEEQPVDYAFRVDEATNLAPTYVQFFPVCAWDGNATYSFRVTADAPLNMYLVPDEDQWDLIRRGVPFVHYPSCSREGAYSMEKTCTIDTRGGLVLENESHSDDVDARVQIRFVDP